MTKEEFRLQLILNIVNGDSIKNGIDINERFLAEKSQAIVTVASAIADATFQKEEE